MQRHACFPTLFLLSILTVLLFTCLAAGATEFYVATDGNDSSQGTTERPFLTLEKARDAVRSLRVTGSTIKSEITIWLRGGDYFRTNALVLTQADSGVPGSRTIWRAAQGETVRLLGARRLTNFTSLSDEAVRSRLREDVRSHVLQVHVDPGQIPDFGAQRSRGFGRPTTPSHCELFCDGKPMTLVRWPNEGAWEEIAGFPEDNAEADGHGGKIGKLEEGFFYRGDRPSVWRDTSDLWVHGYWAWDWANSYERVASIDPQRHLVQTAAPHGLYGFRKGQRFYFLNVLEELDSTGEWFLDRRSSLLYFWPPESALDKGVLKAEVLFSILNQPLLDLRDVAGVSFQSLILEGTRANAVEIQRGASNVIAGCTIRNAGNYGVTINGGQGHGVLACDIFDTGDGGVSLSGGDRQSLARGGHFVENCHFQRQGRWSKCYVPAVLMEGVGLRASHNLIHDHPHCAILFNGNDHLIEFNEIHHIALETGDVGAIYTGRDYTYRGNVIRHNYIHHTGGVGMGSMGVYMDDCVSGAEIFGNIFYKVQRAAFLGGGRDHRVLNNIFVECNHAVELDGRGLDQSPVWHEMVDKTMRDRLKDVPLSLYRNRYPDLKTLDAYYGAPEGPAIVGEKFKGVPPEGNSVSNNICVGKWLNVYWHATPEMLRLGNNLTNASPRFVAEPNDHSLATDFRLQQDSPASKISFQPIPAEKIGLYRDEFRITLP